MTDEWVQFRFYIHYSLFHSAKQTQLGCMQSIFYPGRQKVNLLNIAKGVLKSPKGVLKSPNKLVNKIGMHISQVFQVVFILTVYNSDV